MTPVGKGRRGDNTGLFCTTKHVVNIHREILRGREGGEREERGRREGSEKGAISSSYKHLRSEKYASISREEQDEYKKVSTN